MARSGTNLKMAKLLSFKLYVSMLCLEVFLTRLKTRLSSDLFDLTDIFRGGFDKHSKVCDLIVDDQFVWPQEWLSKYPNLLSINVPNLFNGVPNSLVWKNRFGAIKHVSVQTVWNDIRPRGAKTRTCKSIVTKLVVVAAVYFIWQERNGRLFKESNCSVGQRYICISIGSPSTSMIHLTGSRLARKDEEIVSFIMKLGHKGNIKSITDVVADQMHQPWRTFASIINNCLSGKITGLDKMRLSRALILLGMYYEKNVDFFELLWEDFVFKIDNKDTNKQEKMYYPSFTKAVIHHFITKDKTISMRNRLFMHTAQDDRVLSTMSFVSKSKDFQVYGALLSEKKKSLNLLRKLYLPRSLRENSLLVCKSDTPGVSISKKKAPVTIGKSKGIDLLSEAALLEEAQVKKVLKKSKWEMTIHQAGGSDSDDEPQQADDERTDSKNQEINDDEEEFDDEFVYTPPNYVPIDDETNDESNDVDKEEYDRTDKELYSDVYARLTDAEKDEEGEEDAYMTDVAHNATPKVPSFSSIYYVSSNYTNAFLNLENLQSTEMEVDSMLNINVQHEVPRTSPLLTIPIYVIPEHAVFNPSEIVTISPTTTITSLLSSLFPTLLHSIPIPTPTNAEATTSTPIVLESKTLNAIYLRLSDLEKEVTELKNVDHSSELLSTIKYKVPNAKNTDDIWKIKMEHARKQQVPKETITLSDTVALEEFDQKTTLFNTMTKSKSFNKSPKNRALYHAPIESILEYKDVMDKGVADESKKRKLDDADKDEGLSAGSNQGIKRQSTSQGTETSKKTSTSKDSFKGRSPSTFSKSSKYGKSAKDQVEEPIFLQDSDYAKHDDVEFDNTNMPMDRGEELGKTDEQPNDEDVPKYDCYKPPLTFDDLMHTLIDFSAFAMNHLKIYNLTKDLLVGPNNPEGHRCPYDLTKPLPVQMSSQGRQIALADFFFNNDLEYLRRGSNDKKYTASTTKSKAVRYALWGISHGRTKRQNFYGYTTKMVSKHDVYSTKRILSVISVKVNEWYVYGHLEEIVADIC
uniref:RNA-directed DNA polymerase, eukaryota, reverse transcriptase zinc-binding domain protein n=1 Tax=Tanacetum cinerariifolium TaxID=118510 RepID=A0A6L2MPN8_TANCI|nr:hypothetical protein [Tanacetum cinerariifolium]